MSFKFEFKIDYEKLTALLDTFLKSHSDELTSIMGQCLVLQPSTGSNDNITQKEEPVQKLPIDTPQQQQQQAAPDHKIDNRPMIGDDIPDDPFQNLFQNPNTDNTRFRDRNLQKRNY